MVGNRLKELRQKRLMSLEDVAELVGKSAASISRYENSPINKLNLDVIEDLADALSTSSAYLLSMTDDGDYISETKMTEYPKNNNLKIILVTNNEMAPAIPEDSHVRIRELKPNEELTVGDYYYIEFNNKKCFRMVIDDPIEGVSLMPLTMSERRIAYDKDFAKIIGKATSMTVFFNRSM